MARSEAGTVEGYLSELPEEKRALIEAVRKVVLKALPEGYVESMTWGMPSYEIPLERYPDTYNKKPLNYAALGAQKNYCSLYLMCAYQDSEQEKQLKEGFAKAGKKLNMGKSCVRFKKLEDLPLDVVGEVIASTTPEEFIATYEAVKKP